MYFSLIFPLLLQYLPCTFAFIFLLLLQYLTHLFLSFSPFLYSTYRVLCLSFSLSFYSTYQLFETSVSTLFTVPTSHLYFKFSPFLHYLPRTFGPIWFSPISTMSTNIGRFLVFKIPRQAGSLILRSFFYHHTGYQNMWNYKNIWTCLLPIWVCKQYLGC
jgi:hypothetical protein